MTIKQAQYLLLYLGYDPGEPDGIRGVKTGKAIRSFQTAYGLSVDGALGPQTEKALRGAVGGMMFLVGGGEVQEKQFARHFGEGEFLCRCGGKYCDGKPGRVSDKLLAEADDMREYFDAPVHVTSGMRCQQHNDATPGSVYNSRHVPTQHGGIGKAMDFWIEGKTNAQVESYLEGRRKAGGIRYWYHVTGKVYHMDVS